MYYNLDSPAFISKLYGILEVAEHEDMVAWKSDSIFMIKDKDRFCDEVLPKYFRHTNFNSFIRQLNMYDFHKSRNKFAEEHEYFHPYFKRGQPALLSKIKRQSNRSHPKRTSQEEAKDEEEQTGGLTPARRHVGDALNAIA